MDIVKILKRKDAASVLIAIVLAIIINNLVIALSLEIATRISGTSSMGGYPIKNTYVLPVVSAIVQIVILEILVRIYVEFNRMMTGKK